MSKLKVTVELSPDELKEAVTEYLSNRNMTTDKIDFLFETRTTGYGTMEHDEKVFTGAIVSVTPKANSEYNGLYAPGTR